MNLDNGDDARVKIEIQKTLFSIRQLTLNIKDELRSINEFIQQLGTTVDSTNETLTTVVQELGGSSRIEEAASNETDNEFHLNSQNSQNYADFQEKIAAYLNDI